MRRTIAFVIAVSFVLSSAVAPLGAAEPAPKSSSGLQDSDGVAGAAAANASAPPDPEVDVLGWEGGYWYNESIAVDQNDGLNETELAAVVNRSMARVERVRGLEFERSVPVEVISREEFADRRAGRYENVSDRGRLFHRIRGESRFYINESVDPLNTLQSLVTGGVAGFYSPSQERIVIISENTTAPKIDEITLAQELFHALQDQRFPAYIDRLSFENSITSEDHNRIDVVVEGDGNYVDFLYQQHCEAEWNCLLPEAPSQGGSSGSLPDLNFGLFVTHQVPYSDGVDFVRDLQKREGWTAINDLYEAPPDSTEQVIHPEKFRQDPTTDVSVRDQSTDAWSVLKRPNESYGLGLLGTSASNMSFGEAGIFTMLWYPSFQETVSAGAPQNVVIPYRDAFNLTDAGRPNPVDPYDYTHPASAGWDGDLLVPYATNESAETNETGYVWKIAWDTPQDAIEFRDAYYELLEYYGGERVGQSDNTWRIPESRAYADAFHVVTEGNTTLIVNAPTVDELDQVRTDLDLSAATETSTPAPTPTQTATTPDTGTDSPVPGTTNATSTNERTTTSGQPGIGALGALLAVGLAVVFLRRIR